MKPPETSIHQSSSLSASDLLHLSSMSCENGGTVTPRSRGNDEAVHPLSHLTVLPHELCCAIMHHIGDTMSIVAVTATCKPLMAMADSDFWRVRLTERYPGAEPSGDASTVRDLYSVRWKKARMELNDLSIPGSNAPPVAMVSSSTGLSARSASNPLECSARVLHSASVIEGEFKRDCDQLASLVANGQIAADDIVEWLRSDAATRAPLTACAAIAVLQRRRLRSECEPHALDLRLRPLARALQRLRQGTHATPPRVLSQRVVLKWTAWSSARDCRGFRARDDLRRLQPTLQELLLCVADEERSMALEEPASPHSTPPRTPPGTPESHSGDAEAFWRVLARGVVHEVRSISLASDVEAM